MNKLTQLGIKYKTDKVTHGYTEFYEPYFQKYNNPTILELGVLEGASLRMYEEYFGRCMIVGLDIAPNIKSSGDIYIVKGLQVDIEALQHCFIISPEYDIIIDDGSHMMHDQQASFRMLFNHIRNGGIYIIEDLHTSFSERFNPVRIITTLKLLEQFKYGHYIDYSPCFSEIEFEYTLSHIEFIDIFRRTNIDTFADNSIAAVIVKK